MCPRAPGARRPLPSVRASWFILVDFQCHERHSVRHPKFAKRLKEAGFTEQQAEALADAEAEFIEQNLATKRDIADVKRDIKELEVTLRNEIKQLDVKMEQIRSDLARDLKDLEYPMTIKLGTLTVLAVGAMATVVKVL
jgi:hypothetical protein